MSTIKVDTIATRTGSGNITLSNNVASLTSAGAISGTNITASGTLGVTGAITGTTQTLNRSGNGVLQTFQKDGSDVGIIGSTSSRLHIVNGDTGLRIAGDIDQVFPCGTSGADRDNAIDLGSSGVRFKDLYLGGGLYVGGTGSANALDDFEEGSWTPTVNNATGYSSQFGRYVKVGKMVFINGNINTSTTSAPGATISGLPFASSNTGNSAGNLSIGYYSNIAQHVVWIGGYVLNNSTSMYIVGNSAGYTGATLQRNGFNWASGNSRVMFSGVYETDS